MSKTVLLLGAGKYYKNCIKGAQKAGYRVICIDRDPNAAGKDVADEFYPLDFSKKDEVLVFARDKQVKAIVPLNDYGVPTASYVSNQLGLVGISQEAAKRATDKFYMREAWRLAGLPNPEYLLVNTLQEVFSFIERVGFPVIFKPANSLGGGSRGVQTAHTLEEVEAAFHFAQSVYPDKRVLIEECVTGIEHSAEVVVVDGMPYVIAISDKVKTPYPYRVDEKVIYPTSVAGAYLLDLQETIRQAVRAIGIEVGAAHVELCSTERGPVLFEIGARCGGGSTADPIVSYVTQYPYFSTIVQILSGDDIKLPENIKDLKDCIYGFITVENKKQVCQIEPHHFTDWEVFPNESTPTQTRQGSDRLGYYIFNGTQADLDALLRKYMLPAPTGNW